MCTCPPKGAYGGLYSPYPGYAPGPPARVVRPSCIGGPESANGPLDGAQSWPPRHEQVFVSLCMRKCWKSPEFDGVHSHPTHAKRGHQGPNVRLDRTYVRLHCTLPARTSVRIAPPGCSIERTFAYVPHAGRHGWPRTLGPRPGVRRPGGVAGRGTRAEERTASGAS